MLKRRLLVVATVLMAVLMMAVAGCSQAEKKEATTEKSVEKKEPLKIGAVLSLTGTSASLGGPEKKTLEMEADAINKDGGIDGRKIELYIEDDQSDPTKAKAAVDILIQEKKVNALIGGSITPVTMVVKTEAIKAQIPQVAPAAGITITQPDFKWTFRTAQSDALSVSKVIEYLSKTLTVKKVAVINVDSSFGNSGATVLTQNGPASDVTVVAQEKYAPGPTDVTAQLTKLRSTDAEAIVIWDTNAGSAVVAKNAKQLGIDIPIVGSHGIASKVFINSAAASAEGITFPAGKILNSTQATGEQKKVIEKFVAAYKEKYNETPDTFAGHAFDAFHIIVNAAKKAGNDPAKLRDEIEKTKGFVGISGIFTYTATDHDGLKTTDLVMWTIKDSAWTVSVTK